MLKKEAYKAVINGEVKYFSFNLAGFKAIQEISAKLNQNIQSLYVKVDESQKWKTRRNNERFIF